MKKEHTIQILGTIKLQTECGGHYSTAGTTAQQYHGENEQESACHSRLLLPPPPTNSPMLSWKPRDNQV